MQDQLMRIVASGQPISKMDLSFYTQLSRVNFQSARTRDEQIAKWNHTREFGINLVRTDLTSKNLWTLIIRLNDLLEGLIGIDASALSQPDSVPISAELSNLPCIISVFVIHLLSAPHRDLSRYFPDEDLLARFFQSICHILAYLPIMHHTVQFHEDLIELLISFLSEQVTVTDNCDPSSLYLCTIFSYVGQAELITAFLNRLLLNIEKGNPSVIPLNTSALSVSTPLSSTPTTGSPTRKRFLGALSGWFGSGGRAPVDMHRLAELSAYIVAVIAVQRDSMPVWTNTLFGVHDEVRSSSTNINSPSDATPDASKLTGLCFSYKRLLGFLQDHTNMPHYLVILYGLIYHNPMFLEFVLVQMDPDRLIMPILRFITTTCLSNHNVNVNLTPIPPPTRDVNSPAIVASPQSLGGHIRAPTSMQMPYSHLYISMVILIILTADQTYVDALMTVSISAPPDWFFDKRAIGIGGMSLASLLTLCIMRIVQTNMTGDRDQYLHLAGMAVINNISSGWRNMHPIVALRLVTWLEKVVQRWGRIQSLSHAADQNTLKASTSSVFHSPSSATMSGTEISPASEHSGSFGELNPSTDLAIYTELVSQLLGIIVTVLHPNLLRFNSHLVHALLYKQSLLTPLIGELVFTSAVTEINQTLEYFRARIHLETMEDVLSQINDLAKTYQPGGKQLLSPQFKYNEDTDTPSFFIPFVWHAVYRMRPYLAWDPVVPLALLDQVDQAHPSRSADASLDRCFASTSMSNENLTVFPVSPLLTISLTQDVALDESPKHSSD